MIVSKFNEKKIVAPGSATSSLLSELKLRAIIENARQMSKVDLYFPNLSIKQGLNPSLFKLCIFLLFMV